MNNTKDKNRSQSTNQFAHPPTGKYTCDAYRQEMILLGLKKRLATSNLTGKEREALKEEIDQFEKDIGL